MPDQAMLLHHLQQAAGLSSQKRTSPRACGAGRTSAALRPRAGAHSILMHAMSSRAHIGPPQHLQQALRLCVLLQQHMRLAAPPHKHVLLLAVQRQVCLQRAGQAVLLRGLPARCWGRSLVELRAGRDGGSFSQGGA